MKAVGRHFVTMSCMHTAAGASTATVLVFSGFLVDIDGHWVYITAGHIAKDIQASLDAGGSFQVWRLGDQTAFGSFGNIAIPYDFNIDRWLVIENEKTGLDYAAVVLDDMYCRSLSAGGAQPIARNAWGDYVSDHAQWILVGVPSETVTHDGNRTITARVVMLPLEPVNVPAAAGTKSANQFYALLKMDSSTSISDIDGMSGGPIFATQWVNKELRYTIIGVQSSWYRNSKVIAACPFSSFGLELERIVAIARSEET